MPRSDPASGFDLDAALAFVGGDRAVLAELVAMFIEDSAKLMADIADAIRDDDGASLRRAAHTLSGSLGIFGAASAAEAARQLEALAQVRHGSGQRSANLRKSAHDALKSPLHSVFHSR